MEQKLFYDNLTVSSAPHLVTKLDTQKTMMWVLIALCPALIVSTFMFGPRVLVLTAVCIAACMFFEWAYEKIMKRPNTVKDLSAAVTGTLIAFNVPASFPFWMAIIGCFVAIVLVKQLYGGIGRNFANPAIVARIMLLVSFATQMTTWPVARVMVPFGGADVVTGATPLAIIKETPLAELSADSIPTIGSLFLGTVGGAMGEVSAIALIIGGLILIWKKIISPATPVAFIGTVFVIALIYYAASGSPVNPLQMACYHIFAGGVMLGAIFMATDYVTSPIMPLGKVIMGIGCGVFTMIIRLAAGYPEGVSFSILLMNVLTPLIDMLCIKLAYGGGKKNGK
ncbi:MAG: RnfABCDGE type electron transport complex subunit D [Firmicutes bacterium]|nr:RnfABCDGE type electron transport complex subunit D [Bacillota bacterium]